VEPPLAAPLPRPPQDRRDPQPQLQVHERLRHEVVGPALEPAHAIDLRAAPRQDDQRQRRIEPRGDPVGLAHARDQLEPRGVGQPEVDDRHVGLLELQLAQPVADRLGEDDLVPVGGQVVGEERAEDRVVLDEQDGRRVGSGHEEPSPPGENLAPSARIHR
jgi:hypothetical protein